MQAGSQQWIDLVLEGAARMGITVTPGQADQMAKHAQILLDWNRKINLTAIVDPEQVAIKHFLDAIVPIRHIPGEGELLDIGTGGGFPGIPLKIMRPHQPMTLIDASRKKINFVKHVLRQLALPKVQAIHGRVEDLGRQPDFQGRFHAIVSRAFAGLDQIVQAASPLLTSGGTIIIYQGPSEEARRSHDGMPNGRLHRLQILTYCLPVTGDRRTLVVVDG